MLHLVDSFFAVWTASPCEQKRSDRADGKAPFIGVLRDQPYTFHPVERLVRAGGNQLRIKIVDRMANDADFTPCYASPQKPYGAGLLAPHTEFDMC